jgi:radical SAM superfamily enzyme YgiQ (UPF0313 family)
MSPPSSQLKPAVVLVADRALSASYGTLFEGIFASMQTTHVPQFVMRKLLSPPAPVDGQGRAMLAPLGLRRVEASLLADTPLTADDVVIATMESLGRFLGPWVKIVGVTSSDPLGRGMTSTTTSSFWPGRLYSEMWLDQIYAAIKAAKERFGFKVVAGGAGAWQYVADPSQAVRQGIDVVCQGFFESQGPSLFMDLLAGKPAQPVVSWAGTLAADAKAIRGPSVMGAIELSRGCGKGCRFCTSGPVAMEHLDEDLILADLATNAAAGQKSIVSSSEDFFRYGSVGTKLNVPRLMALLERMRKVAGLSFMQIDHANVSSVLGVSLPELKEIRRLLEWPNPARYLWVNLGIEGANGQLVQANGPGKISPFRAEDWEDMVRQAASRLTEAGFFSVFSIILGLPGETPDDVRRTLRLVNDLSSRRAVIFPIFHEPLTSGQRGSGPGATPEVRRFTRTDLSPEHLQLFRTCYEINFHWVPRLFWDNQRAAGVGLAKRVLGQALGRGEVLMWRRNFKKLDKETRK